MSVSQDTFAGEVACDVLSAFEWIDHASGLHAAVIKELEAAGFDVIPEFPAPYANRRGRIDIVAIMNGGRVAIELDARKPRRKSIEKLRGFNGYRIVGVRGVRCDPPDGINAVVKMDVREASKAEMSDKRIYR